MSDLFSVSTRPYCKITIKVEPLDGSIGREYEFPKTQAGPGIVMEGDGEFLYEWLAFFDEVEGILFRVREVHPASPGVLPHSRACGISVHDHGLSCHTNCPTCHGKSWNK